MDIQHLVADGPAISPISSSDDEAPGGNAVICRLPIPNN
jgi:hypothetical protein